MLTGAIGIAVMAIATPAPSAEAPMTEPTEQASAPVKVPAPPIVILFGLAAGAILIRRKLF